MQSKALRWLIIIATSLFVFGCGSSRGDFVATGSHGGPAQDQLQVLPSPVAVQVGDSVSLTVNRISGGVSENVTAESTYLSANENVATVSETGVVTGVTSGSTVVTVTFQDLTVDVPVTVTGPTDEFADIVLNHEFVAGRAIPTNVVSVRMTGFSPSSAVLYGPVTQVVDFQNVFTQVPVSVTSVLIEYLDPSGGLVGSLLVQVTLVAGQTFVINDPDFVDPEPGISQLSFRKDLRAVVFSSDGSLPRVEVLVKDTLGNIAEDASEPVTVSLFEANGRVLSGTLSVTPTNGLATFQDLAVSGEGSFQLVFRYPGLRPLLSREATLGGDLTAPVALVEKFVTVFPMFAEGLQSSGFPDFFSAWDLDTDFAISDGWDDTFDGVAELRVGGQSYDPDLGLSDLTFLTPLLGAAESYPQPTASAINPLAGSFSAVLAPAGTSSIEQTVNLNTAVDPVNLSVDVEVNERDTNFSEDFEFRVSVLDEQGTELEFFSVNSSHSGNVSFSGNFAGQSVTVRLLARNFASTSRSSYFSAKLDNIALTDDNSTQFLTNGDFEGGNLNGWQSGFEPQSQHVRAPEEVITGIAVVRTVFARPDQNWLRYYDAFTNTTNAPITFSIRYDNNLGSDGSGVTFLNETNPLVLAVMSSDNSGSDNDCGFVFGEGFRLVNPSDNEDIDAVRDEVVLEPGETVGVAIFLLQSEVFGDGAFPTKVNAAVEGILSGFPVASPYIDGLTNDEVNRLINW